jgi:flagellar basal-body rod modification protein FlgD
MTTQPVSAFAAFAASTQQSGAAPAAATPASKEMFLQLLVAQLKNQDPMQPSDGAQFVAQLAQFSQLEQVIAIRQDADALLKSAQPISDTKA